MRVTRKSREVGQGVRRPATSTVRGMAVVCRPYRGGRRQQEQEEGRRPVKGLSAPNTLQTELESKEKSQE